MPETKGGRMMLSMLYLECWSCGIPFGISSGFKEAATVNHMTFFCPRGCRLAFGESQLDVLRKEKEKSALVFQAQINEANHARLVAEKKAKKAVADKRKLERRIAHGVCPCCNKTFADIANHMITEHKDYRLPAGKPTKQIKGAL
jgi:hypothetical protein